MMEEIDFFDHEVTKTSNAEGLQKNASTFSGTPTSRSEIYATNTVDNNEPLRLPRTGGNLSNRGTFIRDTIKSQIPTNEQFQKTKQQAGRMFKSFGNQLSKINLGKIIDKMEQDQGLADSLEMLNSRMKEEVQRQEVRREAEELTIKVITDHLNEFLLENPSGTYEEWIQDLHPENANQGQLLSDIQQIDERFYVMESDHRKIWNDTIEKQEIEKGGDLNVKTRYSHRLVEARTQIWGRAPGVNPDQTTQNKKSGYSDDLLDTNSISTNPNPMIDLFGDSNMPHSQTRISFKDNSTEEIDFFAVNSIAETNNSEEGQNDRKNDDPLQDLFQF